LKFVSFECEFLEKSLLSRRVARYICKKVFVNKQIRFRLCDVTLAAGSQLLTKQSTAPVPCPYPRSNIFRFD